MSGRRVSIGDWTLDVAASCLERGDTAVRLEPRLADLLDYFAHNARRVLTKQELVDALWEGRVLDGSVVARSVAELRKALGDSPTEPRYIETIPKRGYRLIAPVERLGRRENRRRALAVAAVAALALVGASLWIADRTLRSGGEAVTADTAAAPGALEAYRRAAQALDSGGRAGTESAVVHLTRALELAPDFALGRARLAEAYSIRARWYGVDANWGDPALVEASRAVALAPELPEAHRALGLALESNLRFGEAESSYRETLALRPGDARTTARLAEVLMYQGAWPEALDLFLSLDPSRPEAGLLKCEVAWLLRGLDYPEAARAWFDAALAQEPFQICANIRLAVSEVATGDLEPARARLEDLASAHSSCEWCDHLLGEIAYREGRPHEASALLTRASTRLSESRSMAIRTRLAQLSGDERRLLELADELERQLVAGVDIYFPAWLLAVARADLGDQEAALFWLDQARSLGHLDWQWNLAEPTFATLRDTPEFEGTIEDARSRIAEMRKAIEEQGLLADARRLIQPASAIGF